jgi:hypothetical protein
MNSTLDLTFSPVRREMIRSRERSFTNAVEFSVHFFNRLLFSISFPYYDAGNTYGFSMSVSDGFVRKILIADVARICRRHDVSLWGVVRCEQTEIFPLQFFFLFDAGARRSFGGEERFLYVKSTSIVFYIFTYGRIRLKFEI